MVIYSYVHLIYRASEAENWKAISIPILQAKFYYIPPLEGRFQTFWGIQFPIAEAILYDAQQWGNDQLSLL